MFYIEVNGNIALFDIDRKTLRNNIDEFYPQYVGIEIQEREGNIIKFNNKYYFEEDIEAEIIKRKRDSFNKEFFKTSLGYIRRNVTMADGSHKDFLTALLPSIAIAVNTGQEVNVLAYDKPPFTLEDIDWSFYQHKEKATTDFINECFNQLNNDFLPQV